jgi:hypothetical protein
LPSSYSADDGDVGVLGLGAVFERLARAFLVVLGQQREPLIKMQLGALAEVALGRGVAGQRGLEVAAVVRGDAGVDVRRWSTPAPPPATRPPPERDQ